MTMVGAIALNGFRGMMSVDAPMDGDVYCAFIEQILVPNIVLGDTVVMDNLSVHKNAQATRAIESAGGSVLFLPAYSPEFNPIEKVWAKLKDFMRRVENETRELFDAALVKAMQEITVENIRAWIEFAGYTLASM